MEATTLNVSKVRRILALVAVVGGALLVLSLFLGWYEGSAGVESLAFTGWEAFELADALFVLLFFLALWTAFGPPSARPSLLLLGITATVVVFVLITTATPLLGDVLLGEEADVSRLGGAYVALGGAGLLLLAGLIDAFLRRQPDVRAGSSGAARPPQE